MVVGLEFENEVTDMPNICQNIFPDGLNIYIYIYFKEIMGGRCIFVKHLVE